MSWDQFLKALTTLGIPYELEDSEIVSRVYFDWEHGYVSSERFMVFDGEFEAKDATLLSVIATFLGSGQ